MSQLLHQDPRVRHHLYGPSLSVDFYRQEIDRVCEAFWLSPDYDLNNLHEYCQVVALNESVLITEADIGGAIKGQITNLIQAAIGFAAEAGITAAGIGTTAPAGVAAETLTDCYFAISQVTDFVSSMGNLASMAGDMWDLIKNFFTMKLSNGLDGIYQATQALINGAGALLDKIGFSLSEGLEKIKEIIGGMLNKASAAAADFISMLIPGDAGVTGAAIQGLADSFAEDAFDFARDAYNMIPDWARAYWEDAGKMEEFLVAGAKMLLDFCKKGLETKETMDKAGVKSPEDLKAKAEEDEEGILSKIGDGAIGFVKGVGKAAISASPLGMIWDTFGDAIIGKVIKFIEGTVIPGIPKAVKMFHQVVPFFVAGLATFTIIMKEDYDMEMPEKEEGEGEGDEDEATPSGEPAATGKKAKSYKDSAYDNLSRLGFDDIKDVAVDAVRDLRANESKKYSLTVIWEDLD